MSEQETTTKQTSEVNASLAAEFSKGKNQKNASQKVLDSINETWSENQENDNAKKNLKKAVKALESEIEAQLEDEDGFWKTNLLGTAETVRDALMWLHPSSYYEEKVELEAVPYNLAVRAMAASMADHEVIPSFETDDLHRTTFVSQILTADLLDRGQEPTKKLTKDIKNLVAMHSQGTRPGPPNREFELHHTRDYSKFHSLTGNRDINEAHVRKLMESIRKHGLQNPVRVYRDDNNGGRLTTCDGNHRISACARLGYPVPYVVDTGVKTMALKDAILMISNINRVSKKWKSSDYLNAYASIGQEPYQWLQKLMEGEAKGYPLSSLIGCTLFDGGSTSDRNQWFQKGAMKLDGTEKSTTKAFLKFLKDTLDLREADWTFKKWNASSIKGMYACWKLDDFDTDRWFKKIKKSSIPQRRSINDYTKLFLAIYNKDSKDPLELDDE